MKDVCAFSITKSVQFSFLSALRAAQKFCKSIFFDSIKREQTHLCLLSFCVPGYQLAW